MEDLSWKFYFINAAWNFVFLIIAYFTFVETKGLKLEEIDAKFEGSADVIVGTHEETSSMDSAPKVGKHEDVITKTHEL